MSRKSFKVAISTTIGLIAAFVVGINAATPTSAATGDVFSGFKNSYYLGTGAGQQSLVGTLNVPSGGYAITAKLYTGNPLTYPNAELRCLLTAGNDFDRTIVSINGGFPVTTVVLNVVHTFPTSGKVYLSCGFDGQANSMYLGFIKITAVGGSVINNPLP